MIQGRVLAPSLNLMKFEISFNYLKDNKFQWEKNGYTNDGDRFTKIDNGCYYIITLKSRTKWV